MYQAEPDYPDNDTPLSSFPLGCNGHDNVHLQRCAEQPVQFWSGENSPKCLVGQVAACIAKMANFTIEARLREVAHLRIIGAGNIVCISESGLERGRQIALLYCQPGIYICHMYDGR